MRSDSHNKRSRSLSQRDAVGLALAGYTFWVLADTSLKIAGASVLPAYEVVGFVGLAIVLLLLAQGVWRGTLSVLWPKRPGRQALRSVLDLTNGVGVVVALRHLPLAMFYILVFCSPMVTTLFAAVLLGEALEWRKGAAIVMGFAGVVVAVNPLGLARSGDKIGYAACLVCVLSFSSNMVWSRRMTQTESRESLTFCSGALMAVVGFAAMLGHAAPVPLPLAGLLLATGLFCVLGSLCFFTALQHAPAATVSQYHYSQLLTGSLLGYAVWREKPSVSMLLGAALIVASGIFTAATSSSRGADVEAAAGRSMP